MSDAIEHPPHYIGTNGIEVINVIEGFGLGHHLGAALAYILRADRKGAPIEDLKKARFYVDREIANRQQEEVERVLDRVTSASATESVWIKQPAAKRATKRRRRK